MLRRDQNITFSGNFNVLLKHLGRVLYLYCTAAVLPRIPEFHQYFAKFIILHELLCVSSGEIFAACKGFNIMLKKVQSRNLFVSKSCTCNEISPALFFATQTFFLESLIRNLEALSYTPSLS